MASQPDQSSHHPAGPSLDPRRAARYCLLSYALSEYAPAQTLDDAFVTDLSSPPQFACWVLWMLCQSGDISLPEGSVLRGDGRKIIGG